MESFDNLGIVVGEASGDLLGAGLINELRIHHPNLNVAGVLGPSMMSKNCHSLFDSERLAVMGLVEPLFRLPELFKIRRQLKEYFLENPPQVFIGIDSPDFNLGLELQLRRANIPVIHYVSPSVWAWRQKRILKIAKATDLVLTLFPFEADFYHKHHVPATFVGHPMADLIPLEIDKNSAQKSLGLDTNKIYVALLPGSRRNELKYLAEIFIRTALLCRQKNPNVHFITSAINEHRFKEFQELCQTLAPDLPITFFLNRSHDVMASADVVLVTSGTATLEAMLFKKPMVIAYRMANMTFQIAKRLVKIPFIGLPNLLAQELLVPEFIQNDATPANLSNAINEFLNQPKKMEVITKKFLEIHQKLRCNANQRAAKAVIELITKN